MKTIARTTTKKRHQPVTARKVAGWGLLILLIIVTVLPLLWALRTALTPNSEIFSGNYSLIPENATTINFRRVLGMTTPEESVAAGGTAATINFWLYMRNSLLFVAILVIAQVTTSTMAAYALSRLHFRGRDTLFVTLLVALMIPRSSWPFPTSCSWTSWRGSTPSRACSPRTCSSAPSESSSCANSCFPYLGKWKKPPCSTVRAGGRFSGK